MIKAIKIAVSLPAINLERFERVRKELKVQRSALVDIAIRYWLDNREKEALIKSYEEGYRHKPEAVEEIKAIEQLAADAFAEEEWK